MAIEYVGGTLAATGGSTSTSVSIPLDSGLSGGIASSVSDGDLVIAVFATGAKADRTLSITNGATNYTLIGTELYSNDVFDTNLRVGYRFVNGDDEVEFGPTGNDNDAGVMCVYVFRGVDPASPLDVAVTTATDNNTYDINPPAITPVTAGAYIIAIGAHAGSNNSVTSFPGLVETFTTGVTDGNPVGFGIGQKQDWSSGAFNPSTWSISGSDSGEYSWAAMTIALRPFDGFTLDVTAGSFGLTGTAAALEYGYEVSADIGSYLFEGVGVALQIEGNRSLVPEVGLFTLTGASVTLESTYIITADGTEYAIGNPPVTLTFDGDGAASIYFVRPELETRTVTLSHTERSVSVNPETRSITLLPQERNVSDGA